VLEQSVGGTREKVVCFLRVEEWEKGGETVNTSLFSTKSPLYGKSLGELLRAEALATQQALNENHVHSLTLVCDTLTPKHMGFLMMTFEITVATLGSLYEINPFDQPGVERGKVIARSILSQ